MKGTFCLFGWLLVWNQRRTGRRVMEGTLVAVAAAAAVEERAYDLERVKRDTEREKRDRAQGHAFISHGTM